MNFEEIKIKVITPKGHIAPYKILGYGIFCIEKEESFVYDTSSYLIEKNKKMEIKQDQIRDLKPKDLVAIVKYNKNGEKIKDFFKAEETE